MKMKYVGTEALQLKYKGRMIPIKNGTEVDLDSKTAEEFSKREIGGQKQWIEATKETPKKKKKGEE